MSTIYSLSSVPKLHRRVSNRRSFSRDGPVISRASLSSQNDDKPFKPAAFLNNIDGDQILVSASIFGVTFAFSSLVAFASPSFDRALGQETFSGNCAACHTGGNNVVRPEATLKLAALEEYLDGFGDAGGNFDKRLAAIKYQVNNGKGGMPAWEDTLDPEEIEAVANYVLNNAIDVAW